MSDLLNKYSIFLTSLLLIFVVTLQSFNQYQIYNTTINQDENITEEQNCIYTTDDIRNINKTSNKEIIEVKSIISVSSNPYNFFCLGKVLNTNIQDDEIIVYVGESKKFTALISNIFFIFLLLWSISIKSRYKVTESILGIFSLIGFQNLIYVEESFSLTFTKCILILLIFLTKDYVYSLSSEFDYKKIKFRKDINTLRAIAVTSVVLYHADFLFFKGGWLGVDIFFVISGYLISNIILSKLSTKSFSFKEFYLRRVKRIFPALYTMLIVTIPFSYFLLNPKGMIEYLKSLVYSLLFVSNVYLKDVDLYTAEPNKFSPLLHTWSLSIEEQFYILFPAILFFIYKNKKQYILIFYTFFIFSIAFNLISFEQSSIFYLIQYRAWELILGLLIMVYSSQRKTEFKFNPEPLSLAFVFLPIILVGDNQINNALPKLFCLSGIVLILLNSNKNKVLDKLANNKLIWQIGLISYSMYLYHQPIYAFVRNFMRKSHLDIFLIHHIFILFVIFFVSYFSYKYIEKPFLEFFTKSKVILLSIFFIFGSSYALFGIDRDGFSDRYADIPDKVKYYSINTNIYPGSESLDDWDGYDCDGFEISGYQYIFNKSNKGPCTYLKDNASSNFILVGDSHANTLSVTIIYNGEKISDRYNFIPINGTIGRCILSGQNDVLGDRYDCTEAFFKYFLENVTKKDTVAIIGRFPIWLGEAGYKQLQCSNNCNPEEIMRNRIMEIAEKAEKLIIIYPVPTHPYNIAESYFNRQNYWGDIVVSDYNSWKEDALISKTFLDSLEGKNIERVYPEEIFCDTLVPDKCIASTKDELFYTDDNHLTIEGNYLVFLKLNEYIK